MKRFLKPFRRSVWVVGMLVGAGVAVAEQRQDAISLKIAFQQFNLVMTPQSVTGPDLQVDRAPGQLRGRTGQSSFNLDLKPGEVTGQLGVAAVNLKVKKEGDVLEAKGGFGGRPVNLKMSPSELTIYVRDCTYRLKAQEDGRFYKGRRSCDRAAAPASEVWLPDEFLAASPEEKAAILFLAL